MAGIEERIPTHEEAINGVIETEKEEEDALNRLLDEFELDYVLGEQ